VNDNTENERGRNMRKNFVSWLPIFMLVIFSSTAYANDVMRCGSHLITLGDTKPDVIKKCNKPEYIEVISSAIERRTEEWYYDSGSGSFPQVLAFEGYRLINIKTVSESLN